VPSAVQPARERVVLASWPCALLPSRSKPAPAPDQSAFSPLAPSRLPCCTHERSALCAPCARLCARRRAPAVRRRHPDFGQRSRGRSSAAASPSARSSARQHEHDERTCSRSRAEAHHARLPEVRPLPPRPRPDPSRPAGQPRLTLSLSLLSRNRCRRGKVKCVTVDGALPCQVCVSRGHADSCVRGEKGKAADDRTVRRAVPHFPLPALNDRADSRTAQPYVRKRPAATVDLEDLADSPTFSFSGAQSSSRRTSFQSHAAVQRASGRGASLGGASGSCGAAAAGGGGAYAGSPSPSSPAWSPQAVPTPLRAAPVVGTSSEAVKREEGASEGVLPPSAVLVAGCECASPSSPSRPARARCDLVQAPTRL